MIVRRAQAADRDAWCRLRDTLWPGALADHEVETTTHFAAASPRLVVFVAEVDGRVVGFLELDYRSYAPGCASSPVPFIEGWYVEPAWRRRGIGRRLVDAAETLARAQGYTEIASDVELENANGIAAHRALGYEETDRVVSFRRALV